MLRLLLLDLVVLLKLDDEVWMCCIHIWLAEDDDEELSPVADDDDDDDGTKQSRQLQFKQALHKVNAGELLKRLKVRHRVSC